MKGLKKFLSCFRKADGRVNWNVNDDDPKGLAKELLKCEEVKGLLTSTPHFGVLFPQTHRHVSRYDYAMLQCSILLAIKEEHLGLGLGSKINVPGVDEKLTSLVVLQCVAIISNCGHLFGTFATERALLYWLLSSNNKDAFLDLFSERSKAVVRRIVDKKSIYRFHYALSVYFVEHKLPAHLRDKVLPVVLYYWEQSEQSKKLQWILSSARTIAYTELHSEVNKVLPNDTHSQINISRADLIRNLRPAKFLGFDQVFDDGSIVRLMLSAFDSFKAQTDFNSPESAALVLKHLHNFTEWRSIKGDTIIKEMVDSLFCMPSEWPVSDQRPMPHWLTLRLPFLGDDTLDAWDNIITELKPGRQNAFWESCDFIVTPFPKENEGCFIDLYGEVLSIASVCLLFQYLHKMSHHIWHDDIRPEFRDEERLWGAIAELTARSMTQLLDSDSGDRVVIEPVLYKGPTTRENPSKQPGNAELLSLPAYAIVGHGHDGIKQFDTVVKNISNSGSRQDELQALSEHLKSELKHNDKRYWAVVLGSFYVYGKKGGPREAEARAELDGVLVFIDGKEEDWRILEVKSGRKGTGKKQLETFMKNRLDQNLIRQGLCKFVPKEKRNRCAYLQIKRYV